MRCGLTIDGSRPGRLHWTCRRRVPAVPDESHKGTRFEFNRCWQHACRNRLPIGPADVRCALDRGHATNHRDANRKHRWPQRVNTTRRP